jgi:hypothetical protein
MSVEDIVLLVHVLLFVYWLGGDIGVFYSSRFVVDGSLERETRMIAAKIMLNIDLVPRICMSLMLTVGGILSEYHGIEHPMWQMVGIVLLGPVWLALVLTIHFREGTPLAATLTRIDFWFRWILIASVIASVANSWFGDRLADAPWVGLKLLVFAGLVFCGLMIRLALKPFVAAFHKLAAGTITDEDNTAMAASLGRVRPFVVLIWVGLIVEAVLGIVKPFGAG